MTFLKIKSILILAPFSRQIGVPANGGPSTLLIYTFVAASKLSRNLIESKPFSL